MIDATGEADLARRAGAPIIFRPPRPVGTRPPSKWTELPCRCMVPKGLDGLLCTGRRASSVPDTLLRNRHMIGMIGQAAGTAAAMCAAQGIAPRELDVQPLQRAMLAAGFYLGSDERLEELGLTGPERPVSAGHCVQT